MGVDALIAAWVEWERIACKPPKRPSQHWLKVETDHKLAAIAELVLPSSRFHELVAAQRRAGYDVPSAVQAACNQLGYREAC